MGILEGLYRVVMSRNAVYVTFVVAGALVGERYFFTSFLSRDEALNILIVDYKLTFPSGMATVVLINGFHTRGDELAKTIQKIADSLDSGPVLAQLCLGYNYPISRNAMVNLLVKLATLDRFSELNLSGLKLSTAVVDGLCQLANTSCLSELMLGDTSIGTDGALKLMESLSSETQELVKLDLSLCKLTSHFLVRLHAKISLISGITELNLGGNPITQEVCLSLHSSLQKNGSLATTRFRC